MKQKGRQSSSKWVAHINISLKEVVLDPQGNAVLRAAQSLGFDFVERVRVGKYIQVTCSGTSRASLQKQVEQLCDKLLANPVIEQYTVILEP